MTTSLFFELLRWGDFDMSYTDSIWHKENPTDQELTFHKHGILLNEMIIEFRKLSGKKFTMADGLTSRSMYCGRKEMEVLNAFKDYLRARGYRQVTTIKLQFSDEGLGTEKEK